MSLEAYIDIRFGDPVISLSLNYEGLVYGSMMGRLLYYNFYTKEERVINELSEEYIPGVWLSYDNVLYAAIGDQKAMIVVNPDAPRFQKQYVLHEKLHNSVNCELTQVQMHHDTVCLFTLDPPKEDMQEEFVQSVLPIYLNHLSTQIQEHIEGIRFPAYTMPFDFDGNCLLYMEWEQSGLRTLKMFYMTPNPRLVQVSSFDKSYGKVSFARFLNDSIVYVHKRKTLKILDINSGEEKATLGSHRAEVVALSVVTLQKVQPPNQRRNHRGRLDDAMYENSNEEIEESVHESQIENLKTVVISADSSGCICVWESTSVIDIIKISELPQLTPQYQKKQYFSMGYPYTIQAFGPRIAISTDLGVLVIKSKALESIQYNC
ncbi:unnamed protein product [Blepharisma stoltei]|uniref:Uncharacterized protein n=1 Tax=Blepharisma stoltei TaxID=1481888 RepID=A0AAU9IYI7_9CILI|nr:unnamed protein product [Blepharisma stoltei]